MRIEEFLLARVDEDETNAEGADGDRGLTPRRAHATEGFERRRAIIHRHHDQSVTVMSSGAFETVTRCGICIHEFTRPCRALKTLAAPDDAHPDYDLQWQFAAPSTV